MGASSTVTGGGMRPSVTARMRAKCRLSDSATSCLCVAPSYTHFVRCQPAAATLSRSRAVGMPTENPSPGVQ